LRQPAIQRDKSGPPLRTVAWVFRWRVVRQRVGVTSLAALQADDPQRVGPYLLLGRLGSGGMGRVYLARSPGGRQVAVKVIRPQLAEDEGFRARFAREVSAARKVGGLFTAQVVDADLDSPVPWLVTAYVPGTSLKEAVEQHGPLPTATVLALAAGLAEGLNAIHAAGVIHRDLKPSNVLLAPDGPRIIDFGISSAVDATTLTGTGFMIGSPGFMSPEQAEGMPVGLPGDIFSLAGVLIFAARGEGPFGSGDTAALLYRVVHGTPNLDQIPDKIQPLVSRCLSRDAARRPTAAEFLAELTAAYPSAADLSDWLPAGILELSPGRAGEADPRPVTADGAAQAGAQTSGPVAPTDAARPAAVTARVAYEGLANSGNASPPPTQTAKSPVPLATQSVPQAYQGAQAYQTPQGYQGPAGYQAPRGYPGQAGSGGQEAQGASWAQDTPGWGAQPGGGPQQPGGGPQQPGGGPEVRPPMPYPSQPPYGAQPPYPGQPEAPGSQWYSPLIQPGPRRRRRWPWAVGAVAALCALIVAAVAFSLGSSHQATSAGGTTSPRPSQPRVSATPTPTVGNLALSQLRAGDCLTGANMKLNTTAPWPDLTLAVPCNQPHTAEVFFADNKFWRQDRPFPGGRVISKDGNAACNNAFRAYVGIAYSKSIYTWTNIIPDAATWPTGDRALHCVAYYSTPQRRAGATLTHSLKGARR
jgi:eukaryotic-like serine/threonine-protein kinase